MVWCHVDFKRVRDLLLDETDLILEDAAQDCHGVGIRRIHAEVGKTARTEVLPRVYGVSEP